MGTVSVQSQTVPRYSAGTVLDCTAVQCGTVTLYRDCTASGWKMLEKSEQDPSGHAGKFRKCSTRVPSKYPTFGAVLINLSGSTDLKTIFFIKIIAFWVKSSKIRDYGPKIVAQKKNRGPKKIVQKIKDIHLSAKHIQRRAPNSRGARRTSRTRHMFFLVQKKTLGGTLHELAL